MPPLALYTRTSRTLQQTIFIMYLYIFKVFTDIQHVINNTYYKTTAMKMPQYYVSEDKIASSFFELVV